MVYVSLLTPALEVSGKLTKGQIHSHLGISAFTLYKLVPIYNDEDYDQYDELIIKSETNFSLTNLEQLIAENRKLSYQVERSQEALFDYAEKYKQISLLLSMSKNKRIKKLEAENVKLRENFK